MKVILISGYKENFSLVLDTDSPGSLIDFQIKELLKLNAEIVVSLAHSYSDKVLSQSKLIDRCEIVFDTNENPNWITNVKAGLYSIDKSGFILPLETPTPHYSVWKKIITEHHKVQNKSHFIQPCVPLDGKLKEGFPLFITEAGKSFLLEQDSHQVFDSSQLKITKIPVLTPDILYKMTPGNLHIFQNHSSSLPEFDSKKNSRSI